MRKLVLFIIAFIVWSLLTWIPDVQHLIVGFFVSLLVAFLTGDLFVERPHVLLHLSRYFYFIFHYLPVFLWECLKANIDVAYRVIHPKIPIRPGIVKVKTGLKTDTALTFLANSITLTPGTLSVDIDKEKGLLYVHCIYTRSTDTEEATRSIAGRFEGMLHKIFD